MTEEQRIAELMKPRYKVIADFPFAFEIWGQFKVGNIIALPQTPTYYDAWFLNRNIRIYFDKYPHLFKPLEWYEDRKPEEMPGYVKYWDISLFFPVDRVCKTADAPFNSNNFTASNFLPATLAEYQQYMNSKQQP